MKLNINIELSIEGQSLNESTYFSPYYCFEVFFLRVNEMKTKINKQVMLNLNVCKKNKR